MKSSSTAISTKLRYISEFGPLFLFLTVYGIFGLFAATAVLVASSLLILLIFLIVRAPISSSLWMSTAMITIFGSFTLFSGNSDFIKMKPTFLNLLFGMILLIGALCKRSFLKPLLQQQLKLSEKSWLSFSTRMGVFFLLLAALNEWVWRYFSEAIWVQFKVFGIMGLLLLFFLSQMPFLMKEQCEKSGF